MTNEIEEVVTGIKHWNDSLFSITTTRRPTFTFENGQFVMMGIEVDGRRITRPYSIASANYESELEFFSIKVPQGALTSRLQHIKVGQKVLLSKKASGTLVAGYLTPGKHLYLLATGTGLAPFLSIVKDPGIYDVFDKIILVHSVRHVTDLAYQATICDVLPQNEYFGDEVTNKLIYHPIVTRESFRSNVHQIRITELLQNNCLTDHLGLPKLCPSSDRFMLCGNQRMLDDIMDILNSKGFKKATSRVQGDYVIEHAFLEK